ncbi:MAG: DUF92 domain-containing protein [Bacteroidota bacterium]
MISHLSYLEIIAALLITTTFCWFSFYKNWLTAGGGVLAGIIGLIILLAGGLKLSLPILLFFISGSLFGKLKTSAEVKGVKDKKPRDYLQVFCNGGIPAICIILFLFTTNEIFITGYFISISICTSDTWSSELGTFYKGVVLDIITLKKVSKGKSGGISFMGTLAGLAGAFITGILYYFLYQADILISLLITAGGFAGMLLDSILGSTLQVSYILPNGERTESPGTGAVSEKGLSFITNDLVNLVSNVVITFSTLCLLYYYG